MTEPSTSQQSRRSITIRRLTLVLFLYFGWYVGCAVVALWRAASMRGEWYLPAQGDAYTGSSEAWPGALDAVWPLLTYTALLGNYVAVPAVVFAGFRLADPEVRASRATWTWLLVGALLVAGTVVVGSSDPGDQVRNWILD
ncbi:MAG TPA: hypothetical protein VK453_01190 [Micromonosporaceae bacterium]|nr:hypothetical protein [Micromonosporaceae bacterium]